MIMAKRSLLLYPVPPSGTRFERIALNIRFTFGFCPVCGRFTVFGPWGANFRETGYCRRCRAFNRQRQMAYMICRVVSQRTGKVVRALPDLSKFPLSIYNTEASGALHCSLYKALGGRLSYSEYFGPQYQPGEFVGSTRHEDLCALSYPENSFDIVLTSDVLEHVYDPYLAFKNIYNVLKVGGVTFLLSPSTRPSMWMRSSPFPMKIANLDS